MFCNLTYFSLKNACDYTVIYVCDVLWALESGCIKKNYMSMSPKN
jgi:hypothetical protein